MNKPRGQHYIPRFYLANFIDSELGQVYLYDRFRNNFRKDIPDNITVINHYYTITGNEEKDFTVEKKLSDIEGNASGIFRKLISLNSNQS